MKSSDLSRRALLAAVALTPAIGAAEPPSTARRRRVSLAQPKIICDDILVTSNQRYAVFRPRLVDAQGQPTVAVMDMDATWTTKDGWAGDNWGGGDYWRANGTLRWRAGNAAPDEGEIVMRLGAATFNAKATRKNAFGIGIHLGDATGARPGYTDVGARCTVQAQSDAERPQLWSLLPVTQAALDAIRPGAQGVLRSTFKGYDCEDGETGVDIHNGQVPGVRPFTLGADGRVHLRCAPLTTPIRDFRGRVKSIGQARLIAPVQFKRGDLIEMDVAQVTPGWLITWTTGEFGWPWSGEVDFGEYRPDWCSPNHGLNIVEHYPGATAGGLGGIAPLPDVDLTRPHVRSVEWTADDQIIARVDGVERQRWPMLWDGSPHSVIVQATAYTNLKPGDPMPEISIGAWRHYRPRSS